MIEGRWEVIRLGLSDGITLHFIDRDTEGCPPALFPMPDPLCNNKDRPLHVNF